jgi:hypothetical protein
MISIVQPLPVGNALRLYMEPPAGAVRWKVLRMGSDSFTGHDDPGAALVYDGDERVFVDTLALPNGSMAFYKAYHTANGTDWTATATASGTPAATFEDQTTDVLAFLRERIEAGLKVEVDRGNIVHTLGYVQTLVATPSQDMQLQFPLVTLHLESEDPGVRALGEEIASDRFDTIGDDWDEAEGWLANVRVTVIAWSLNGDERMELRKALRRIIIANLPIFYDRGWQEIALAQQDVDSVGGEFNAPLYQVLNTFTCLAPAVVAGNVQPIRTVLSRSTND